MRKAFSLRPSLPAVDNCAYSARSSLFKIVELCPSFYEIFAALSILAGMKRGKEGRVKCIAKTLF
jgi:hypothetical protein